MRFDPKRASEMCDKVQPIMQNESPWTCTAVGLHLLCYGASQIDEMTADELAVMVAEAFIAARAKWVQTNGGVQ